MPPLALSEFEYATLTVASGRLALVMLTGAPGTRITMVAEEVTRAPPASLTVKLTLNVPPAVGVPPMLPEDAPIETPGGRPFAEKEYGCKPPTPLTLPPYAVPTRPVESDPIFEPKTVTVSAVDAASPPRSETPMVALNTPAALAEPPTAPVAPLMPTPGGRPLAVNAYGGVPPATPKLAETDPPTATLTCEGEALMVTGATFGVTVRVRLAVAV